MGAKDRTANGHLEQILAWIASRQHGIVTRAEALVAGISRRELAHRVRIGYLIPIHRGVYRVGHSAPSALAAYMAATKACGDGCGLSGLAAAHLLQLVRERPVLIEVTAPRERRVKGIRVHRARRAALKLTERRGIPVVTPAWALIDIADRLEDVALGWACHHAINRHALRPEDVTVLLSERGSIPGSGRLRRILSGDDPLLLSRLEAVFLELLRDDALPLPATNRKEDEGYVDCRWPGLDLVVELDSYRFHNSRRSWERDRERDRAARARGDDLIRLTWQDVVGSPEAVRAEMRSRLRQPGARDSLS